MSCVAVPTHWLCNLAHIPLSTFANVSGHEICVVLISPIVLPSLCPLVPIMYSAELSLIAPKPLLNVKPGAHLGEGELRKRKPRLNFEANVSTPDDTNARDAIQTTNPVAGHA